MGQNIGYILGLKYGPKKVNIEDFDIKKYLKDLLDIWALKILDRDDYDNRNNDDNVFWISGFYDESEAEAFRYYLNKILYLVGLYATDIRLLKELGDD